MNNNLNDFGYPFIDDNEKLESLVDKAREQIKPKYFICEKCLRTFPLSEAHFVPKTISKSGYLSGTTIQTTAHIMCKECSDKEDKKFRNGIILFLFCLIVSFCVLYFAVKLEIKWSLILSFFISYGVDKFYNSFTN